MTKRLIKRLFITIYTVSILIGVESLSYAQKRAFQEEAVKYGTLLNLAEQFYVDSVDVQSLTEAAIIKVLAELDPHSAYISKDEVAKMNEPLQGSFDGVGISFRIHRDTLMVLTAIPGGPAERVGILPGDKILVVDSDTIVDREVPIQNSDVFKLLRGKRGSRVVLGIERRGISEILEFVVLRDKIPINSLDAAYMLDDTNAYIKLNKFAKTTNKEFSDALSKLQEQSDVTGLVLDLRGNGGGYLESAIQISSQLLPQGSLVVFTSGLHSSKIEYRADGHGLFEQGHLIVLIDEFSASSSEIVTGAVQDWDRGVVIGRRSFGKGLVQRPFSLPDRSMIRLTTAHYYTPAGRNIQKPYSDGTDAYHKELLNRVKSGELYSDKKGDNSTVDSLRVQTLVSHRSVYSGGGITPDIIASRDTSSHYRYINRLLGQSVVFSYSIDYLDKNRAALNEKYTTEELFIDKFKVTDKMLNTIVDNGVKAGVERNPESMKALGESVISRNVKAYIARELFGYNAFYRLINLDDKILNSALEVLGSEEKYSNILKEGDDAK